ncbi:rod shape-determining protein MreD [Pontiella sp.]|uniref:rod shape-determining protein MreD n=1 Tax=Pontiella sp. TaxID=2837462 RepID=UPI00356855E1
MKRRLLMILLLALAALLQQVLPAWPLFGGMKPPILAAMVLYYALRRDNREMWIVVFVAAVLQDGLNLGSFGPALLAFPAIGIVANKVRNEVFADGLVSQLVFGAAAGLFTTFSALLIYGITGQRPVQFGESLMRLGGSFWLGMATLPLVSLSINKLEAALPKRKGYGWQ